MFLFQRQPKAYGDAKHVIDYGKTDFGIDAEHWTALQAIHGAVHQAALGVKYTWFGPGYLSNMYFKWIANKPRYFNDQGGDLSFNAGNEQEAGDGKTTTVFRSATGDANGDPVAMTGW